MNELKPEDVMRALELRVQRELMPNVDIDGTVSVENAERWFLKLLKEELSPYVSALLREKDARIKELEAENREMRSNWQKLKETLDAVTEEDKRILAEKDAEIERLKQENQDLHDNLEVVIEMVEITRSEAITEFAEKLIAKKCHYTETEHTFDFDGVTVEDIEQTSKEMKEAPK